MFTLWLNSETRKVMGLIAPCHRPCQNPAMCPALTCATLFGPAAQAAKSSRHAATSAASAMRDFDISTSSRWRQHGFAGWRQAFAPPIGTLIRLNNVNRTEPRRLAWASLEDLRPYVAEARGATVARKGINADGHSAGGGRPRSEGCKQLPVVCTLESLSLIHISEPTRLGMIS